MNGVMCRVVVHIDGLSRNKQESQKLWQILKYKNDYKDDKSLLKFDHILTI